MIEFLIAGLVAVNMIDNETGDLYKFRFVDECPEWIKIKHSISDCGGWYNEKSDTIFIVKTNLERTYEYEWYNYTSNGIKTFKWICNHESFHKQSNLGFVTEELWMNKFGTPEYEICDRLTKQVFGM